MNQEAFAGVREAKLSVAPVQQRRADFVLENGNPTGDGRLCQGKFFRRAGDALQAGHPDEGLDKSQVHGWGLK